MPKKEANDLKIAIKSCFTMLVEDTTLIQNAATPYPVEFAFSKDWDGFAKTALFEAGGVSMAVVLSEDKCGIPGECLKKGGIPLKIAVYGVKGEERKSTGWHVTSKILFPANISVVAYITEAINALSIGDYAKTTEVTAAINTALESYYTKTQVDETFVKKTDIVMATDEEVDAMLTEVFGAQATV